MFSHVTVGVTDFDRAFAFYSSVLSCLGLDERFCDRSRPWAGWQRKGEARPLFLIGRPFDQKPHDEGNGQMTAFLAAAKARGCRVQVGADMLFEQIPAYLEYFGLPTTTADVLRSVARLSY